MHWYSTNERVSLIVVLLELILNLSTILLQSPSPGAVHPGRHRVTDFHVCSSLHVYTVITAASLHLFSFFGRSGPVMIMGSILASGAQGKHCQLGSAKQLTMPVGKIQARDLLGLEGWLHKPTDIKVCFNSTAFDQ